MHRGVFAHGGRARAAAPLRRLLATSALFALTSTLCAGAEAPARLTLYMGFGGTITDVGVPASGAKCASKELELKQSDKFLFTSSAVVDPARPLYDVICVSVTKDALNVQVLIPYVLPGQAKPAWPIDFEYPAQVSCVPLKAEHAEDFMLRIFLTVDDRRAPIECDVSRSFLYALAVERHGSASARTIFLDPSAPSWHATIEIPWTDLKLRHASKNVTISAYAGGSARAFSTNSVELVVADHTGALVLDYAPFLEKPASAQSSKKPPLRLYSVGADTAYVPDWTVLGAAAFAQNDATSITQRSISQILSGSAVPLPTGGFAGLTAETLSTRTQPLLTFLKPSKALGDQDLQLMVDAVPFSFNKVGSLASGYTAGYSDRVVSAAGFFGLQRPGLWNQAYALTIAIPTPEPKLSPSPTPAPSPTPQGPIKQSVVAPPPFTAPGTIEDTKTLHDPLVTLALLEDISANAGYIDSVSGAAFGANLYRNTCATEPRYCAVTLHLYGNIQSDAHPRVTSPATATPPYATTFRFAGESASYTTISSPDAARPAFFQVAETVGVQQADRFFSPASGSTTPYSPLGGALGRVVLSYGSGEHEHVYAADFIGIRMTSPYGDVFTDAAWQLVVPFDFARRRDWKLHAGAQSETLSDRIAELQQGLATSYYSTVFPTAASLGKRVAAAVVRPQTQYDLSLSSPTLSTRGFSYTLTAGYQTGFVTNCAPAPTVVVCATGHDHAATFAFFGSQKPFGFGVASTSSASIPGDLAVGSTARYFGSYVNAPGSVTSYVTFNKWCSQASGAYSNAAYPTGVPLPQQGSTVAAKLAYPFGDFGLEASYFKIIDRQDSTFNQSGFYTLLRFTSGFGRPHVKPSCSS